MRYAICLILGLLLSGCKLHPKAPEWPKEVKSQFAFVVDEQGLPRCFSFEILSVEPYVLGEPIELTWQACDSLSGFLAVEANKVMAYKDRSHKWAQEYCKGK